MISLMLSPTLSRKANATGAELVPVVGELVPVVVETAPSVISGLLEALGVIEVVQGVGYAIREGFEFVGSLIETLDPFILTIDEVVELFKHFADGIYFTDSKSNYYVAEGDGFRLVTSGDVYVRTDSVAKSSFSLPLNTIAVCNSANVGTLGNHNAWGAELGASFMSGANHIYALGLFKLKRKDSSTTFYSASTQAFTYSGAQSFETYKWFYGTPFLNPGLEFIKAIPFNLSNWTGGTVWGYSPILGNTTLHFSENGKWEEDAQGSFVNILGHKPLLVSPSSLDLLGSNYTYLGHSYSFSASDSPLYSTKNDVLVSTYLLTNGAPVVELFELYPDLEDNADKIDDSFVRVPEPPDNLAPNKEYVPLPPEFWEFFKDIKDVLANLGGDTSVNADTTLGDFINNNYNYNTTVIDVPEFPDAFTFTIYGDLNLNIDANINGTLDVNHGGSVNINVTVNDDVNLPEVKADDGSGLIDMTVTDVIGGLTTHNPVIDTLKAMFEAIDPTLRALFITAVSLSVLLGLWKLIKG